MPLYTFTCPCGRNFDLMRTIARRDDPALCTACGRPARRAVTAPRLAVLSTADRIAHQRNERSAHEPRRVTRESPVTAAAHTCDAGHGHGRPWMLGH